MLTPICSFYVVIIYVFSLSENNPLGRSSDTKLGLSRVLQPTVSWNQLVIFPKKNKTFQKAKFLCFNASVKCSINNKRRIITLQLHSTVLNRAVKRTIYMQRGAINLKFNFLYHFLQVTILQSQFSAANQTSNGCERAPRGEGNFIGSKPKLTLEPSSSADFVNRNGHFAAHAHARALMPR